VTFDSEQHSTFACVQPAPAQGSIFFQHKDVCSVPYSRLYEKKAQEQSAYESMQAPTTIQNYLA
jgi:hypothetical protein